MRTSRGACRWARTVATVPCGYPSRQGRRDTRAASRIGPLQAADRLSRFDRPLWIGLFYAVLAAAFCAPLFAHPQALGSNDWDQHLFYYGVVLKNVVEYAQ